MLENSDLEKNKGIMLIISMEQLHKMMREEKITMNGFFEIIADNFGVQNTKECLEEAMSSRRFLNEKKSIN